MDGIVIAFVALQAIALAVALAIAWSRGRALDAVDEALREAGSMVGRTAIEALGDHRVEAIARQAREGGWASGEVQLVDEPGEADRPGATLVVRARRSPILGVWLVLEDVAELRRLQRIRA